VALLSVDDLFVAGVGFDLAGALLLGRGLLDKPGGIAARAGMYWNLSPPAAAHIARDRVDGQAGICSLIAGFALQLVGYVAVIHGAKIHHGTPAAAIALGLGILVAGTVVIGAHATQSGRLKRVLVDVACKSRHDEHGAPLPDIGRPAGPVLGLLGEYAGWPRLAGEPLADYLARVFAVSDFEDSDST
jgi:hypothetical protein